MFDAYTVKKVMPRLVIAAILIQLSWPLFTLMIEVVSQIAWGVEGLMYAPFGGREALNIGPLLGQAANGGVDVSLVGLLGGVALGGAVVALGGLGLLSLGLTVLLALLIAFFVLAVRQVVIIVLLVTAPLALVAWILPNTEKIWKIWWESFSKLLFMYPLILLLIAGGRVAAKISAEVSATSSANDGFGIAIVLIAFFGPFFFIPSTFKLAGSAFANISGIMNDRSKGAFDRLKNYRGQKVAENAQKIKAGQRYAGGTSSNWRGGINRTLQRGAHVNKAGLNPAMWGNRINAGIRATDQQEIERNMKENADYQTWMGNDSLNKAAAATANSRELREYLRASGNYANDEIGRANLEADVARVESVRRGMGASAFKQMTTLQAIAGGTAYENAGEMMEAITAASGNDDAAAAYMIAKGKSAAMAAGRIDQGGAGFGKYLEAVNSLRRGGTADQANDIVQQSVIENQGPGSLMHSSMKTKSIENLAPQIRKNLVEKAKEVRKGGTPEQQRRANDEFTRELAKIAGTYDAMSQTSPAQAEVFADQVMGEEFVAGDFRGSIQQLIENNRGNQAFLEMRREYSRNVPEGARGGAPEGGAPGEGPAGPPTAPV